MLRSTLVITPSQVGLNRPANIQALRVAQASALLPDGQAAALSTPLYIDAFFVTESTWVYPSSARKTPVSQSGVRVRPPIVLTTRLVTLPRAPSRPKGSVGLNAELDRAVPRRWDNSTPTLYAPNCFSRLNPYSLTFWAYAR